MAGSGLTNPRFPALQIPIAVAADRSRSSPAAPKPCCPCSASACVHACSTVTVTVLLQCKLAMPGEKEKQVAAKPAFSPQVVLSIVSARSLSALCALQRRLPSGSGHPSDRTSTSFRLWISNHAVAAYPHTHTPPVA
jgi:hypothetical protein